MRCEDFEVRLNDVLDERRTLASDAALAEHARRCGACGELARGYEELLAGLSHELPPAPAWLAERAVEEALLKSPGDQARSRFVERLPLFALAASVLVAAGVMWWNGSRQPLPNKRPSENWVVGRAAGPPESKGRPGGPPHDMQSRRNPNLQSAAKLADDGARQTAETAPAVVSRMPGGTDDANADVAGVLPGTDWAPAGAHWAQEVADGLRPVTRPTVGAISGFLNLWGISPERHQS